MSGLAARITQFVFLLPRLSDSQNLVLYLTRPSYLHPKVVPPRVEIEDKVERSSAYWRVPIFIICRDRLYYLQMLVSQLHYLGYFNLIVVDNNSTYQPLLSYYKEKLLWVIHLAANLGNEISKVLGRLYWNHSMPMTEYIGHFGNRFVLTDSDILFESTVPRNWLQHFWEIMDRQGANTVGAALRLDDIPEHYAARTQVWQHECEFWRERNLVQGEKHVLHAAIDTTMALRRLEPLKRSSAPCLRVAGPYTAKHLPWYEDSRWLLPDVAYARKNRERGHTFGWWSMAEGFARRGKSIIDSNSPTGQFKRAANYTLTFPAGADYVGFCRRFSAASTVVRPPQCQHSFLPSAPAAADSDSRIRRKGGDLLPLETSAFLEALSALVKRRTSQGKYVVLDVGAGGGIAALWFAQLGARVVALEPLPSLFDELCRNIAASSEVQAHESGLTFGSSTLTCIKPLSTYHMHYS